MVGTSFSSFPNAPGAPSGQRGTGSLISACTKTEKAASPARNKLVFMARVVGYFASEAELNQSPVAFNEEVFKAMLSSVNLILSCAVRSSPSSALRLTQTFGYA